MSHYPDHEADYPDGHNESAPSGYPLIDDEYAGFFIDPDPAENNQDDPTDEDRELYDQWLEEREIERSWRR